MQEGVKRILVTGGSGYVGNYILRASASLFPDSIHYGMSRRGAPPNDKTYRNYNISFLKGDCLKPEEFPAELEHCDAVIHSVGILLQGKGYERSYKAVNTDSCVNVARALNEFAASRGERRKFVMISSEKAPPLLSEYLTSKLDAEKFLFDECQFLDTTVLRPGFIVSKQDRWWSVPLSGIMDCGISVGAGLGGLVGAKSKVEDLLPARSV